MPRDVTYTHTPKKIKKKGTEGKLSKGKAICE